MPDHICYACFEDTYLREMVHREGALNECRVCEEEREGISVARLGEILAPIMRENLQLGQSVPEIDDNDRIYYRQLGDSIAGWVQEFLGQYFEFEDEIVDAVVETDDYDPRDGGEPFWDDMQSYERVQHLPIEYHERWQETLVDVKHRRRFFSEKARQFFTELFEGVENMYVPGRRRAPVVRRLAANRRLFRARVVTSTALLKEMLNAPLRHVGPPPPAAARAGRMNAEGVSVFYGSLERDTCLSEMRPAIGNDIVLIEVATNRKLRILDFARLENARSSQNLSFFQPDFSKQRARRQFLRILHEQIAQPVTPGHESDYLITQTMAEFLSHLAKPPFDGIMFQSTQRRGGTNIVLFPNAMVDDFGEPQTLPVSLTDGEVSVYKTQSVSYTHERQNFYRSPESDEVIPLRTLDFQPDIELDGFWNGDF
ncbi:RES family NAD+ phosphorylase [Burkholderia territorii]|uniref:RES family NAD+ phosphorylase n=1 Tax=Burkholderia territorii TaxID=1503055 RepID=UPI0012D8AEAF|nr:RES family NAD+ phosphorylase [Burkholderia territorii]